MVHGFADTGRLFRSMNRGLEARGHSCHTPTLHPRDGRLGMPDLSGKLEAFIHANLDPGSPVALVGFSMGALIARHYLQVRGGAGRTRAFFSIAGPNRGTPFAYLYPGAGTRQMRPGSAFLRDLNSDPQSLAALPVFTYRTPLDLMVFPPGTTRLPGGSEHVVWCPLHSMLSSDSRVIEHIAGVLAGLSSVGAERAGPPGSSVASPVS
jgi:triacylglycerol lipase